MRITFINVGYGDSILFQASSGYTLLLDGGSALPGEFAGDPYRVQSASYLRRQGISRLDAVIISHIHEDHVCGLEPLFEELEVGRLLVPYPMEPFRQRRTLTAVEGVPRSVPLYAAALNAYGRILTRCQDRSIPITVLTAGEELHLDPELVIQVLAPCSNALEPYLETVARAFRAKDPAETAQCLTRLDAASNSTSLLLRMTMGEAVLLAAADSVPSQWHEVPSFLLQNVNVLKLPHHGQIDSISEDLMQNMPLTHVITTASSDRRYSSANQAVYETLTTLFPPGKAPSFLFSDEREYPPYFSHPEGFQAIQLVIDSGGVTPEFIKIY